MLYERVKWTLGWPENPVQNVVEYRGGEGRGDSTVPGLGPKLLARPRPSLISLKPSGFSLNMSERGIRDGNPRLLLLL